MFGVVFRVSWLCGAFFPVSRAAPLCVLRDTPTKRIRMCFFRAHAGVTLCRVVFRSTLIEWFGVRAAVRVRQRGEATGVAVFFFVENGPIIVIARRRTPRTARDRLGSALWAIALPRQGLCCGGFPLRARTFAPFVCVCVCCVVPHSVWPVESGWRWELESLFFFSLKGVSFQGWLQRTRCGTP